LATSTAGLLAAHVDADEPIVFTQMPQAKVVRPSRTKPIAVRFDEFTLTRLRALAWRRNTGYQTLLKEFVVERLYEEEKREGIIE
jgi:hypothetical protein